MQFLRKAATTRTPGYSIIEIMLALGIIAGILYGTMTMFRSLSNSSKTSNTTNTLQMVKMAIDKFQMDTSTYPSELGDLIHKPSNAQVAQRWIPGYLSDESSLKDGWGNDLEYRRTQGGQHPYELFSLGRNGEASTDEEHISVWAVAKS